MEQNQSENTENKQLPSGEKVDRRKSMPHLFKKGQSGNPAGKPKGATSLTAMLRKAMDQKAYYLSGPNKGKPMLDDSGKQLTWAQAYVRQTLHKGVIIGSDKTMELIMNRLDGKVPDRIQFTDETPEKTKRENDLKQAIRILSNGEAGKESELEEED